MIELRVDSIESVNESEWSAFYQTANNATLFSKPQFYRYHDEVKPVQFYSFIIKNQLVATCVGAVQNQEFRSPFAASYGGISFNQYLGFEKQQLILDAFLDFATNQKWKSIQFTLPPLCYSKKLDQSFDFILRYKGFTEEQTLISSVITLNEFDDSILHLKAFQQLKKAQQDGVTIKKLSIEDVEAFYPILLDNKSRYDLKPTHTLTELYQLFRLFPEEMLLYGAFYKDKLIAGALNFVASSTTILCFYIAMDYAYQQLRPINLLNYFFIRDAQQRGFQYLDLGVSHETNTENPMDPRVSLIRFKENFGAKGQLRTRLKKIL